MKKGSASGSSAPPPKMRFAPKIPVQNAPKQVVQKESSASKDDIVDKELLAKLNRSKYDFGRRSKAAKKVVEDQVTFGYGSTSTQARSFGVPQARTQTEDDSGLASQPKEYVEPWDYVRSNYPVTLPLRRPYSGDPEVLDQSEFGKERLPLNENRINAAQKLGFMETERETDDEPEMIFLQLPSRLPLVKPKPLNEEEEGPGKKAADASTMICKLKDIPAGFMGKLLVYRSGKVKMKLGDVLFDVSPGIDHTFAEEVVAVNAKEKRYCVLGELRKHAVVTPDIDSLLG